VSPYRRSLLLLVAVFILVEGLAVLRADLLRRPVWGDESHFIETVRAFGVAMGPKQLLDYREVTPPLVYVVYALWGRLAGFDLQHLRMLSLVFSLVVYIYFHRLLFALFPGGRTALYATAFLMISPYMLGTSIFVFTDMLTMVFVMAFLWSVFEERPLWSLAAAAGALLSRQYTVFMVLAAGLVFLFRFIRQRDRRSARMAAACAVSVLPLAALFLLWKGMAPPSGIAYWNPAGGVAFHFSYVSTYVSMIVLYCLPLLLLAWRALFTDRRILLFSLLGGIYYVVFPIAPSRVTLEQTSHLTVGLVHRALELALPGPTAEHVVLFVCFVLGLPLVIRIVRDGWSRAVGGHADFTLFLDLSVVLFLLLMPLSYQTWEKYLLPLLPVLFIRLLMLRPSSVWADPPSVPSGTHRHLAGARDYRPR
jgi:hypothetical protein